MVSEQVFATRPDRDRAGAGRLGGAWRWRPEEAVTSLDSFGVFKDGQKIDVATTYDMKFVKQAVKDLKLP